MGFNPLLNTFGALHAYAEIPIFGGGGGGYISFEFPISSTLKKASFAHKRYTEVQRNSEGPTNLQKILAAIKKKTSNSFNRKDKVTIRGMLFDLL